MRDHAKLRVFELADEVTLLMHRLTKDLPNEMGHSLASLRSPDRLHPQPKNLF